MRSLILAGLGALALVSAASAQTPSNAGTAPGSVTGASPEGMPSTPAVTPVPAVPNGSAAPSVTGSTAATLGSARSTSGSTAAATGPAGANGLSILPAVAQPSPRQQELIRKNDLINRTVMRSVCRGC